MSQVSRLQARSSPRLKALRARIAELGLHKREIAGRVDSDAAVFSALLPVAGRPAATLRRPDRPRRPEGHHRLIIVRRDPERGDQPVAQDDVQLSQSVVSLYAHFVDAF